jgi:hypothetical protein
MVFLPRHSAWVAAKNADAILATATGVNRALDVLGPVCWLEGREGGSELFSLRAEASSA